MKKRTKTDIVAQILYAAIGGSTKTKIMYETFLTYRHVKDYYIPLLVKSGLLETDESETLFRVTGKGQRFLRIYEQLEGFLDVADITLKNKPNKRVGQQQSFDNLVSSFVAGTGATTTLLLLTMLGFHPIPG